MTNEEKYQLIADLLREQHDSIKWMTDEQLLNNVELMARFFNTSDPIFMEASVSTMYLIAKNAKYKGEYEESRKEAIIEMTKKLLQTGMSVEEVLKVSPLSKEELDNLKIDVEQINMRKIVPKGATTHLSDKSISKTTKEIQELNKKVLKHMRNL